MDETTTQSNFKLVIIAKSIRLKKFETAWSMLESQDIPNSILLFKFVEKLFQGRKQLKVYIGYIILLKTN